MRKSKILMNRMEIMMQMKIVGMVRLTGSRMAIR
jgi:hypothetical protein